MLGTREHLLKSSGSRREKKKDRYISASEQRASAVRSDWGIFRAPHFDLPTSLDSIVPESRADYILLSEGFCPSIFLSFSPLSSCPLVLFLNYMGNTIQRNVTHTRDTLSPCLRPCPHRHSLLETRDVFLNKSLPRRLCTSSVSFSFA